MANGGGRMEGQKDRWKDGQKDGRKNGCLEILLPPPCFTRHRPFGAAAQKEIKLNGVSFKSQSGGSKSLIPVLKLKSQSGGSNPSLEAQIPALRLKSQP